jgi:membrane protein required for colicin V production
MLAAWILLRFTIALMGQTISKDRWRRYIDLGDASLISEPVSYVVAFLLIAIVVRIVFSIIIHFVNKVNNIPGLGFVNRAAGAVLGFCKGCLVIVFVIFLISCLPKIGLDNVYKQITNSDPVVENMIENNLLEEMIQQSQTEAE